MNSMNSIDRYFTKLISFICITLMAIMTIIVITNVILRYVFSISFVWAEELITFLFLGTTYFGVALGVRSNEHIRIDFLLDKLGSKYRRVMNIFNSLIIVVVQVVVFRSSIVWIQTVGNVLSPGIRIPIKCIYILMPMSCIFVCFYVLLSITTDVKSIFKINQEKVMEG